MTQRHSWAAIAVSLMALSICGWQGSALAQEETKTAHELRADYDKNLKGKTIAFLPLATGVPLMDEWGRVIKTEAEWRGMKFIVRDPALNPAAMQQALTALIDEKPDVIVVQNPSVTLLMKELKRAESQGIHVVQMNMSSNYKSDAFVGADWYEVGKLLAEDVVKACGTGSGTSGEVQIVQGELTAAASVDQIAGIMDTLNKDKAIKVVSNQAALWDANKALEITATVIQQHPNLCASIGFWGIMESGAAQAIRNAGKIDKVKVYASGEGSQLDCDQLARKETSTSSSATPRPHRATTLSLPSKRCCKAAISPAPSAKNITRVRFGSIRATRMVPTAMRFRSRLHRRLRTNRRVCHRRSKLPLPPLRRERIFGRSCTDVDNRRAGAKACDATAAKLLVAATVLVRTPDQAMVRACRPFTVMIGLAVYFALTIKDYGTTSNLLSLMRLFAEFGFVALGIAFP